MFWVKKSQWYADGRGLWIMGDWLPDVVVTNSLLCVIFSQPTRSSSESICSRPGSSIPGSPGHTIYVRNVMELYVFFYNIPFWQLLYTLFSNRFLFTVVISIYPCVYACLSLFVSLGKSRQWDPWLQRPSCHSKSQSHLWHWAPWSYYLWTFVHHFPGWERGETRECGRGKHTDRMHLFLHACHLCAHYSTVH